MFPPIDSKDMRTYIHEPVIGRIVNQRIEEMPKKKLAAYRCQVAKDLSSRFDWKDYDKKWCHLLYYVEYDDEAAIYPNGYLMTEEEFELNVATRIDICFAGVLHRR